MPPNHHRLSEAEAIALLARVLAPRPAPPAVVIGIGDDAAVLRIGSGQLVWTVDACVEGVHFERRWLSLEDLGWKSLMAAASDLAAMGAEPIGALAQLALPRSVGRAQLTALARGQARAARAIGCPVIGGNLSQGSELAVATTVLGRVRRPIVRSGARPGDGVFLAGAVGRAALGLRLLQARKRAQTPAERAALAAWRRPLARIELGRGLARRAHAAIDVSDGLAGDAAHVARASGVKIVLDAQALLAREPAGFALAARRVSADPLELMLFGGEDYALLAASAGALRGFSRIGRVEPGRGVWLERPDGTRARITRGGYDHLRSR